MIEPVMSIVGYIACCIGIPMNFIGVITRCYRGVS